MFEALHFEFIRNALVAGLLISLACGIIGTLVVVNRIVFISGGIAHAAYGGVGLALYCGLPPQLGITVFSLGIAIVMALVTLHNKQRADTIIGVLWAVGMALGIILVDLTPGYNVDLMSYLFGSILTVPSSDLVMMICLDLLILAVVTLFYKDLVALSFDEEFAAAMGVPVRGLYVLLLVLLALSVVMIIRVVGLILVIALLTIPPYIAERFSGSIKGMMMGSAILGAGFTFLGLWLSYSLNLTPGATIILMAGSGFFVCLCLERMFGKKQGEES